MKEREGGAFGQKPETMKEVEERMARYVRAGQTASAATIEEWCDVIRFHECEETPVDEVAKCAKCGHRLCGFGDGHDQGCPNAPKQTKQCDPLNQLKKMLSLYSCDAQLLALVKAAIKEREKERVECWTQR